MIIASSQKPTKLSYLITLQKITDEGLLLIGETDKEIAFQIKRFYTISNVEKNAIRGKHAHLKTKQILFCIQGTISVLLDDGKQKETITLSEPGEGIFFDTLIWHEMIDFSNDCILLVVASEKFDESDYIRNYKKFSKIRNQTQ